MGLSQFQARLDFQGPALDHIQMYILPFQVQT